MALENLLYEVSDGIAKVTINRPKALNALNPKTMAELREVFTEVRDDTTVGVAILTGAGDKAFVAGSDIVNLSGLDPGLYNLDTKIFEPLEQVGPERACLLPPGSRLPVANKEAKEPLYTFCQAGHTGGHGTQLLGG